MVAVDHLDAHLELVQVGKHVVAHVVEGGLSAEVFVFLALREHPFDVLHDVSLIWSLILAALFEPALGWPNFLIELVGLGRHLPALSSLDLLADIGHWD